MGIESGDLVGQEATQDLQRRRSHDIHSKRYHELTNIHVYVQSVRFATFVQKEACEEATGMTSISHVHDKENRGRKRSL